MVARISLVFAVVVSAVSSEASGQRVADLRPSDPPSFVPDAPAWALEQQRTLDEGSFVGVTVVSALFGGLGAVGGVYAGAGMGGGGEEAIGTAIVGGFIGAWLGAGLGGTAVSRRPGRAFLGSALGMLPGLAVLKATDDARGAVLGFLMQGIVTALVTQVGS